MVTVYQYLHGFTDGKAPLVTAAAVATLQKLRSKVKPGEFDPNLTCAIGFAIHLLGDSFAHRRLHSRSCTSANLNSPDCTTYPPGSGHYRDNHDPDYILYSGDGTDRPALWLAYAKTLAAAMGVQIEASRWDALSLILSANVGTATSGNYYHQPEMIKGLKKELTSGGDNQTAIWAPYKPPVEELGGGDCWLGTLGVPVVCKSFQEVVQQYHPPGTDKLDYHRVWKIYKEAAIPEFGEQGIPAVCPADEDPQ